MPVFDLRDGKDLEAAIERMLVAGDAAEAVTRLRAVFVESLDFAPATGIVSLDDAALPAQAARIAQRENVQVVAVILKEANVRADRCRAALKEIRRTLGDDVLLVAADAARDEWQLIYPTTTAGREVLRRMVVRRGEKHRTVTEQLTEMYEKARSGRDFRRALEGAYDVEAVTRKFFRTYRDIFFDTVMPALSASFPDEEQRTLSAQKLFNRLLFIRFLEKKGWLTFAGRTDYLRALWEDHTANGHEGDNFYRDRLCLLFFEGLNQPLPTDRFAWRIGTVPYLNGGLFEQGEDDRSTVDVPDSIFTPIMDGLLYHFNFTVTEATPLEVEVAVDPEMLGKVFEELVTGRHESGSYYTPKPIVAFMGREALKGYLATAAPGESADALARFVDAHDASAIRNGRAVLDALETVRICDPACGSGAYLLGMLHELLDLRQCLFRTQRLGSADLYKEKLAIIQRNLYGVDLKAFAVNIARLRLWLSLAVEYDGANPPPLPNLDYRIEAGDSLTAPLQDAMTQSIFLQAEVAEFFDLKAKFMDPNSGVDKDATRARINHLRAVIGASIHAGAQVTGFDWTTEFNEVFVKGGFDIVLANPPYVRQELISALKPTLKTVYPAVYAGTADLYCYFYARALQLLKPGGMLAFISSNKWFRAAYGKNLRAHIAATCAVRSITDFGDLPVFESATAYPMIFIAQKKHVTLPPQNNAAGGTVFTRPSSLDEPYPDMQAVTRQQGRVLPPDAINGAEWSFANAEEAARLRTMAAGGVPLGEYVHGQSYRGILTGFNEAFVIDAATRTKLISEDPQSTEIIKALAAGRDVHKWRIDNRDRWLIVTEIGVDIKRYPAIFAHLQKWQPQLERRWDKGKHWWELRACDYYSVFDKPKIIFPDIAKEPRFTHDKTGAFTTNTSYFVPTTDLYLLGVLNSPAIWGYCKERLTVLGDADEGGRLRFFRQFVERIPIPNAPASERAAIADLVQQCLDARGVGCAAWEGEIDARVARLYGL